MARLDGPLFSIGAHGTFGPVTYQKGRKTNRAIRTPKPPNMNTNDQQIIRSAFAFVNRLWNANTDRKSVV